GSVLTGNARAIRAKTGDREVGEIRHEPMMGMDQRTELVGLPERERVVPAAPATRQVNVLCLVRLVVLGTGFEVRMLQDADLFEQGQRTVDRRGIDARHLA